MKRILLATLISATVVSTGYTQNSNNICVYNHMDNYNKGGGPDDLEGGMKCSDEAATNETTVNVSKTWFYRGELYTLIFSDSTLRKKYGTSAFEAVKAFKKLQEINDSKFRDWDEVFRYMEPLSINIYNEAVDLYHTNNYANAYKFFYAIKDIDAVYKAKGKEPKIALETALDNAGKSAESAGDTANQIKVYRELLELNPSAKAYLNYAITLRKAGKMDELNKTVDEGLAKYPKEGGLLTEKINIFLEASKAAEAISYINRAIENQPKNDMLWFVKGLAYEKISEDSLMSAYNTAITINPSNFKAQYNLGAHYFNQGTKITDELNALGNTEADRKKYDALKKKQKEYFLQAKPYFEKAHNIDPKDPQANRTLNQINLYTGE